MIILGHLTTVVMLSPFIIASVAALMPAVHDADTAFDSNQFLFDEGEATHA